MKHLKLRPNQEVADFYVVLEKLARQANPEGSLEDRSIEYAHILLDNLSGWPEHFQLVGAPHKVEPRKAYEEVKQLALSIEQSKIMLGTVKKASPSAWKSRFAQYKDSSAAQEVDPKREERSAGYGFPSKEPSHLKARDGKGGARSPSAGTGFSRQESLSRRQPETRKCYHCSRYGHLAKECPSKTTTR